MVKWYRAVWLDHDGSVTLLWKPKVEVRAVAVERGKGPGGPQDRRQGRALAKVGRRVPFKKCACGSATIYEAYNAEWVGWEYWCYMCGRKDAEVWEEPVDGPTAGGQGVSIGSDEKKVFAAWWKALSKEEKKRWLDSIKAQP